MRTNIIPRLRFAGVVLLAGAALAAGDRAIAQDFKILNKASGMYLTALDHRVVQENELNDLRQTWTLVNLGGGVYKIVNKANRKALTVTSGNEKTPLTLASDVGSAAQRWRFSRRGAYFLVIPYEHNRRAMDVPDGARKSVGVQTYRMHGGDNQQWFFHGVARR
jgi:hypothetical protein